MSLKMYILVNEDIKISKGKLAGQVGHAVLSYAYYNEVPEIYMKEQKKIILSCPKEKLLELERDNNINGRGYSVIRDLGLTDLEPNTLTCINVGILNEDMPEELEFIKKLNLYR